MPILAKSAPGDELVRIVHSVDQAGNTFTYAFTVMPDHCHWLFQLNATLSLSQVVAKFKFLSRDFLRKQNVSWQRDFYDHRLRSEEIPEDYALYIFLNSYRAKLLSSEAAWPWWWSAKPGSLQFIVHLNSHGGPPAVWLEMEVPASIRHGE